MFWLAQGIRPVEYFDGADALAEAEEEIEVWDWTYNVCEPTPDVSEDTRWM